MIHQISSIHYLKVGEDIGNESVTETALLYLRHLPEIPEDFIALASYSVMMSFLRHPEKFNFRAFRSNCGLGAVERERELLTIAVRKAYSIAPSVERYRVTKVVKDTVFVDFSMRIAPLALAGGDFI